MRQEKIILSLVVFAILLSICLFTGIGYAVETDNLVISDSSNTIMQQPTGFNIAFSKETIWTTAGSLLQVAERMRIRHLWYLPEEKPLKRQGFLLNQGFLP